jgi:NAD(P)-dependent dehydrogenase (short-subunit alcohol dehydrogenase family)
VNRLDLMGRHAIVTGAASGIGLAISRRLVASGARVCAWDVSRAALDAMADELGPDHLCIPVDMANDSEVASAAARSIAQFGNVHILVNNAGITGPNAPLCEYPPEAWRKVFDVNVHGVFSACKHLATHMQELGIAGRIVNVASVAGKEGNPNASAYSASKAAVIALTKSLGKELAATEIRVNCVTPAAVETPLFDQMTPEHVAYMRSKIPLGRFGRVDEIAAMVAWLCTEECSFSTGAVFDLSGGRATY